jgi:hypothetical protein
MMKTVVVVRPAPGEPGYGASWAEPTAHAFETCFHRLGWHVQTTTSRIKDPPDLIAGYGWRPVMRTAWERWPERILHTDLAFWSRESHLKLALGGRWSPLADWDYDESRLKRHRIVIGPSRTPGRRILVCGMSAKAAGTWGLEPEEWERATVQRLIAAGASSVIYRPKPTWPDAKPIARAKYDSGAEIDATFPNVDAVVSHHSNAAVDALAVGLPIYVETGIAKALSVPTLEGAIEAKALDRETRESFLRQVAWHQWTLDELKTAEWLKPPAPLAGSPIFSKSEATR